MDPLTARRKRYRYQSFVTSSNQVEGSHHERPNESNILHNPCSPPVTADAQRMDSNGSLRPLDESPHRELPQLPLRIAPLREPVSSRTLRAPSPLEPRASGTRESNNISKGPSNGGNIPANPKAGLPTVTEFLNAARTKNAEPADPHSNVELPPRPILPAFVNLRALERFPFASSFDDDALHGQRKRRRLDLQPESFSEHLQLPIPQAQKEQRPPPFGPFAILNGLNEPPPNAALLPPSKLGDAAVEPGSLVSANGPIHEGQPTERREARIEELLGTTLDDNDDDDTHDQEDTERPTLPDIEHISVKGIREKEIIQDDKTPTPTDGDAPLSPKTRGRSRKNLRKWTEEETTDLLRGVVKCGIGNWTTILAQPELKFNKRTASNLKDRFRVCCPWAYRASDPNEATKQLRDNLANTLLKAHAQGSSDSLGKAPGKIHIPPPPNLAHMGSEPSSATGSSANSSLKASASSSLSSVTPDTDPGTVGSQSMPSSTQSTPHSETSQTTLESLGLPEAHVTTKSKRRSRRPFTTAEDEALLKGYAVHGFQWTLIQQDKRLNLGHRRATDLRDRFRTKFPHAYRDGGSVSGNSLPLRQGPPTGTPGPAPRDRLPSGESTPTKVPSMAPRPTHSRNSSGVPHNNPGPGDPALLPPPQGFFEPSASNMPAVSGLLSFPLDDNNAGPSSPWEDNTLAPMVWDDLG
ncbi:hypothetical protein N7476_011252 [Penicillium atrosanguineum]|uniref:Myb-like domain-containing protein n=1 Tax=Penicillium atrosanguineum TaxID=1132637 RepID=A0A9W9PM84_9EURO|nr:hypothetical protein N7526_010534 [Penicillium atrosanguineum]KAJ5299695.1 hypothetical protein N7476_011252 [Penicillium atrosanguineum]